MVKVMSSEGLCNPLNDTELKIQFKRAIQMLEIGNTDESLKSLNIALQEARSNLLVPVLLERATASMLSGNFGLAHKDLSIAIEHAPQSPEGYIQACNLFLMQGDYRGAWLTAEKGVASVPLTDPKWRALDYLKKAALSEINKTNIWRLPYDVLSMIGEKLEFIDRVHLAASCKYWRNLLYDSPAVMWGDIDFRSFQYQPFVKAFTGVLSQHVRTIRSCNTDVIEQITELLEWKHIEHLETTDIDMTDRYLRDFITRNAETLKTFDIASRGSDYRDAGSFIQHMFSTCPKLTSFAMYPESKDELRLAGTRQVLIDNRDFPSFEFTTAAPLLTHLTLTGVTYFCTMLPKCPNLLHVQLYEDLHKSSAAPDIFALAEKCCPKLITLLCIHCSDNEIDCKMLIDSHPTTKAPAEKGIRHLAYLPGKAVDKNVITTVAKNRSTLEHLQLGLGAFPEILAVVRTLTASPFPRLTRLELHGVKHPGFGTNTYNPSSDKLCDLVRACPVLESLSLVHIDILTDHIFTILGDIATLQKLHIVGYVSNICEHGKAIARCGIRTLFERSKSLKDVAFCTTAGAISLVDLFCAMSAHPKLEKIRLGGEGEMVIDSARLQIAKSFTNVSSLTLSCKSTLTIKNGDLRLLEWLPSLSTVKLEGATVVGITNKGLDGVFQDRRNARLDISVKSTKGSDTSYSSKTWNYTTDVATTRV